jgi:hypothetical protein
LVFLDFAILQQPSAPVSVIGLLDLTCKPSVWSNK